MEFSDSKYIDYLSAEMRKLFNVYQHIDAIFDKRNPKHSHCTIHKCKCNSDICDEIILYCRSKKVNIEKIRYLYNIGIKLDWESLSLNEYINIDDIFDNPEFPWVSYAISMREDLSPELIRYYAISKMTNGNLWFNWDYLTENPFISIYFIISTPQLNWNKLGLVLRHDMTQQIIHHFPEYPWYETFIDTSCLPLDHTYDVPKDWILTRKFIIPHFTY